MNIRLRSSRTPLSLALSGLLLGLVVGCTSAPSYPVELRYPPRADLLLDKAPGEEVRSLPPPGHLDVSITQAAGRPGAKAINPSDLGPADRKALTVALEEVFGTPAAPSVEPTSKDNDDNRSTYDKYLSQSMSQLAVNDEALERMQLDRRSLKKGSELYRKHCMHCHGVVGDGRGPTGPWLHPHPRDYRKGEFKFISASLATVGLAKPRRDDLIRTLEKGIDGTSMPAFNMLPAQELQALASYVIHLSLRGQVEYDTIRTCIEERGGLTDDDVRSHVYQKASFFLAQWANVNVKEANKPPAYPFDAADKAALEESIRRGHALFIGKGICITCHYDYGRQSPYKYDNWGTLVRPRDLTQTTYRGGRRPLDLYWRISGGIGPSGMPKFVGESERDYWDLINFVQHVPYPAMLPRDVRAKVYREPDKAAPVADAGR